MSAAYFCPRCAQTREATVCPICEGRTEPLSAEPTARLPALAPTLVRPGTETLVSPPSPQALGSHLPEPATVPPSTGAHDRSAPTARVSRPRDEDGRLEGQRLVEDNIARGYGTYVIAGIGGAGKTELISAFNRSAEGDAVPRLDGRAVRTAAGVMNVHHVTAPGRKLQFVDVAGERFTTLHRQRRDARLTREDVHFLEILSRRMAGIVLLLNLKDLWQPAEHSEDQPVQIEVLAWTLKLLRFFACGGVHEPQAAARFDQQVEAQVGRMTRRLSVPVLLLFSKADELHGTPAPEIEHTLVPVHDAPLFVAQLLVPALFGALAQHCQHFRCDFAHSLVLDPDSGRVSDRQACGVQTSLQWLLDPTWSRPWPRLPTRFWLAAQQMLDRLAGRGARWDALPVAPRGPA